MLLMKSFDLFPEDVLIDILSRLPLESILECRRVCKTLRNLLLTAPFAYAHMHRQLLDHNKNSTSSEVGFIVRTNIKEGITNRLYYVKYEENNEKLSCKRITNINCHHPHDMRFHCIVGSCNGLICFTQIQSKYNTQSRCPINIYNPITGEYVNLPRYTIDFNNGNSSVDRVAYGFGYHPPRNEYKVVMIYYDIGEPLVGRNQIYTPLVGRSQVYTLGSESGWRNKGEIKCSISYSYSSGIFANGGLYWLDRNGNVVSFDLADETFKLIPLPPSVLLQELYLCQLKVLGGDLCLVDNQQYRSTRIWSLGKNNEWKIGFRITWGNNWAPHCHFYVPFVLTKQGKILVQKVFDNVLLYDPESGNLKQLDMCLPFHDAHPYAGSFVSLKALGEVGARSQLI